MDKNKTFLITAIGSLSASSVIRTLKQQNTTIIGCDIHPGNWVYNSKLINKFIRVPKADEVNYLEEILRICEQNEVDFIIPLTDPEVDILSQNIQEFKDSIVCTSSEIIVDAARNKEKIAKIFQHSDIEVIPTYTFMEISSYKFDSIIAKPKKGRSSEGILVFEGVSEINNSRIDFKNYIFQPFLIGQVITVDVVRDKFGNSYSLPRKELIRTSNGAGLTVEIFKNKKITDMVNFIGDKLNFLGCVNIEFLHSEGRFFLMDINPRFSAGIGFSQLAGAVFIENHITAFSGEKLNTEAIIKYGIYHKICLDVKN